MILTPLPFRWYFYNLEKTQFFCKENFENFAAHKRMIDSKSQGINELTHGPLQQTVQLILTTLRYIDADGKKFIWLIPLPKLSTWFMDTPQIQSLDPAIRRQVSTSALYDDDVMFQPMHPWDPFSSKNKKKKCPSLFHFE